MQVRGAGRQAPRPRRPHRTGGKENPFDQAGLGRSEISMREPFSSKPSAQIRRLVPHRRPLLLLCSISSAFAEPFLERKHYVNKQLSNGEGSKEEALFDFAVLRLPALSALPALPCPALPVLSALPGRFYSTLFAGEDSTVSFRV
jgi:hypothetical protein